MKRFASIEWLDNAILYTLACHVANSNGPAFRKKSVKDALSSVLS